MYKEDRSSLKGFGFMSVIAVIISYLVNGITWWLLLALFLPPVSILIDILTLIFKR
jgi:hypothetical protein